jgi:hypothetical protein
MTTNAESRRQDPEKDSRELRLQRPLPGGEIATNRSKRCS